MSGLAALLLALMLFTPPRAAANNAPPIDLPGLVSTTQASYTPNVVIGPWPRDTTTQVWGYVPMSGVMYVCGDFARVRSADGRIIYTRHNLFAFDPNSGGVLAFAPDVNGPIYTCAPSQDGASLFIGGEFDAVNGQAAPNIAKITVATGELDSGFLASADRTVTGVQLVNGRLMVSGSFTTMSGSIQPALATVDPTTGAFDPYLDLSVTGHVEGGTGRPRVFRFAVDPAQTNVVAIGNFSSVNGVSHSQVFRFELQESGPELVDWDNAGFHHGCSPEVPVWTRDVQFSPDGTFFVIDGTGGSDGDLCDTASRWETSGRGGTTEPTWVNHTCVDTLHSVAVTNTTVYIQGHQKCVMGRDGHEVRRFGIAALNAETGFARHWRSDQTRRTGGKFLMITDGSQQPGFPAGLWAGCDCGPEGGIIFRAYDQEG